MTRLPTSLAAYALALLLSGCAADSIPAQQLCDPADRFCDPDDPTPPSRRGDTGVEEDGGIPGRDLGGNSDAVDDAGRPIPTSPCDPRSCAELDSAGLIRPDYDEDGIADCVEGTTDPDEDGVGNCADDDSDNDLLMDAFEGEVDSDGDGIGDYLDTDSDNDNILDRFEQADDPDEDGIPSYLDLDSDGDGWPDASEYGRDPNSDLPPIDRSGDGVPDFLDLDSDGDGLADAEETGCPTSTDRTVWDTDSDGYNDLVEVAFGSNPCDPADDISEIVDFYFELPFRGPEENDILEFSTEVANGDVVFNMDTTGSMSQEIGALRRTLSSVIIPEMGARLDAPAYSVSYFDDFPCGSFGNSGDLPWALLQRITLSRGDAQAAVDRLPNHNGGDYYESGFEALYQIATGEGTNDCRSNIVPPFDPGAGYIEGVSDGWIGGVGFREGALPMIVHVTDAPSQSRGGSYPYGHTREEAYAALGAIGAKVIGVASGADARADTEQMATATNALVPACAWDGLRPGGCAAGQCCTGINGSGRGPNGSGLCPLVFDISGAGAGLDSSIVSGISALINFAPITVSTVLRTDPEASIDTTCFLKSITPDSAIPRAGSCSTIPEAADLDGDGTLDGFTNVTPGTQLFFQVVAQNQDCMPPSDEPLVFIAYIDVIGDGTTVLDTQLVTILVPPDIKF